MNHLCRGVKGVGVSWVQIEFKTFVKYCDGFHKFLYYNSTEFGSRIHDYTCFHVFFGDYAYSERIYHLVLLHIIH